MRSYRTGTEASAAVRTYVSQMSFNASSAERAFVRADHCLLGSRRQILVAPFAIRPQLQQSRLLPFNIIRPRPQRTSTPRLPRASRKGRAARTCPPSLTRVSLGRASSRSGQIAGGPPIHKYTWGYTASTIPVGVPRTPVPAAPPAARARLYTAKCIAMGVSKGGCQDLVVSAIYGDRSGFGYRSSRYVGGP